jgi:hypothetical protein
MLICAETFRSFDGEMNYAGITRVVSNHEIVRRHPEKWSPDGRPVAGAARASVSRSTYTPTKTRGTPRLLNGSPRLTVALSSSARRTIDDEFFAITRSNGLETGGWLFGETSRSWKEIGVRFALGPGKGARHGSHAYQPTADYLQVEEELARNGAEGLCRIGDWHSHVGDSAEPSPADLDVWQTCFLRANEKHGAAYYLGLIVAEGNRGGVVRPKFKAFALRYDQLDRVVCEPANLKEH